MFVGILVIGNEVLDGITLDTNSNWLGRRLRPLGAKIKTRITVRDDISAISWALHHLIELGCDVIFVSGGFGPTHDDMTLQGIAYALDMELELNLQALDIVERQYQWLHKKGFVDTPEINKPRRKMAKLPKGAIPLDNRIGGAPGVLIERNNVLIFALPGVPAELKSIYEAEIEPILLKTRSSFYSEVVTEREVKDESMIAPLIDQLMTQFPNLWVKSLPPAYGTSNKIRFWFSLSSNKEESETLRKTIDRAIKMFDKLLKEQISDS
ncbi:MAG: competence/damage-inducible protein A [Candidatus Heimdallarchaeota archaeon]